MKKKYGLVILIVTCLISICYLSCNVLAESTVFNVNINPVLTLTVPGSVNLNLTPTGGIDFNTASANLILVTNNPTGYTLTMTASSDTLTRTGSVIDPNTGDPYTPTILTLGEGSSYTAEQFESTATDAYTLNRWGYKLHTNTNYIPMVTDAISLATTNAPSSNDTVTLDFAAKVDNTKPAGTYQTTLNFTAVTNAVPISSINDLEYMQQFATLTDSEMTDVLSSMTTGQQYQLKDNRDEKTYYISKLADGNVWMTQNLDHDIVTTANFYTPQNTDIPANWTASAATYATSNTNWYDVDDSYSDPESYDPGDLCWNGTIRSDYNGTIANSTVDCDNDKHYHIGNYYNWTAAVAMNNSSSYTTDQQDVDQSICPAGWRLPTYSGNKSYDNLVTTLSLTSGTSGNVQSAPAYFVYGGSWSGESYAVGGIGYYRSSVVNDADFAYEFYFGRNGLVDPQDDIDRAYGFSVRCVARSTAATAIDDISDLEYMQDFATLTSSEKADVLASMTLEQQYQLKDNRDEKTYYISKLADGNVWMTQNLDHDIVAQANYYTPQNTDIPSAWTPVRATYPTATTGTSAWCVGGTWNSQDVYCEFNYTPESYDPGNLYWNGTESDYSDWEDYFASCDYTTNTPVCDETLNPIATYTTNAGTPTPQYHIGNFYNWSAAVAMNDTSSLTTSGQIIDQSICPAGWTLPRVGTGDDSFYALWNTYGFGSSSINGSDKLWQSPLYTVSSGGWYGYLYGVGHEGFFWSPVVYYSLNSYGAGFNVGGSVYPSSYGTWDSGSSVRCILRPVASTVSGL